MCAQHLGQLPEGVRDLLPAEAKYKRNLEKKFAQLVEKWGYQEIVTPTFEYVENFAFSNNEDKLYKFLDRSGNVVAMKPDTTIPIARLVALRMKKVPLPLKFYYLSHAFRYEESLAGRQREIYQAGVELLGSKSLLADAEVIALAIESAKGCGLKSFKVSLGSIAIFNKLMSELELPKNKIQAIKKAVEDKDFVLLERLCSEPADTHSTAGLQGVSTETKERIIKLLSLQGDQGILSAAYKVLGENVRQELDDLSEVYRFLKNYDADNYVTIDLGLLPKLNYYTGVVFELYTLGIGIPICSGGRYDFLSGYFGYDLPATGFALSIDSILEACREFKDVHFEDGRADVLIAWIRGKLDSAIKKANELRKKGIKTELKLDESSLETAKEYADKHNIKEVIYID